MWSAAGLKGYNPRLDCLPSSRPPQYCMLAEAGAVRPPNELVTNSQYLRLELDRIVGDEPAACKKRQKESGEPDDHQISEKV